MREQHDGDRMTCKPFREPLWRTFVLHFSDHQRVEADDDVVGQPQVRLRGVRLLVRQGEPHEKPVEGFVAAVELVNGVMPREFLDAEDRH